MDEYVTPGRKLLTIVDDADLEVEVSLDSRDGVNWLRLSQVGMGVPGSVCPKKPVALSPGRRGKMYRVKGRLDRVVRFDPVPGPW